MLAAISCAGTSFYAPRVTRIWPYKIICYNVCVYVFVQKIYIHSMSCSLTIALDARDSNKMSMNVLGTYLQIFFAYTQNSISTKTKEEKKIAQGHTHLPILAKFFYLMPSHFFFRWFRHDLSDRVRFCVFWRSLLLLFLVWLFVVQF